MFTLHPQLDADTVLVKKLPLSLLLLSKDANYPWCILVPQRQNVREIHQLSREDRRQLLNESCQVSEVMEALFKPVKMNVAALGNMVPQLHLHHIARFEDDLAWPKPIWGVVEPVAYKENALEERIILLRQACTNVE